MSAPAQLGPPVLLPSARVGRQVAINRSDKPVYLDLDGKPLCQHGEKQCAHPSVNTIRPLLVFSLSPRTDR